MPLSSIFSETSGGLGYPPVANYSALPSAGSVATNTVYLVLGAQGLWPINRKPAGLYKSDGLSTWTHLGAYPDILKDANFGIANNADPTKIVQFDLSNITAGVTRLLKFPNFDADLTSTLGPLDKNYRRYVVDTAGGFPTIQSAINQAVSDGYGFGGGAAIIEVHPGLYTEDLTLVGNIHIIGLPGELAAAGGNTPTITGRMSYTCDSTYSYDQNSLVVKGLTVLNLAASGSALYVDGDAAGNLVLHNCNLAHSTSTDPVIEVDVSGGGFGVVVQFGNNSKPPGVGGYVIHVKTGFSFNRYGANSCDGTTVRVEENAGYIGIFNNETGSRVGGAPVQSSGGFLVAALGAYNSNDPDGTLIYLEDSAVSIIAFGSVIMGGQLSPAGTGYIVDGQVGAVLMEGLLINQSGTRKISPNIFRFKALKPVVDVADFDDPLFTTTTTDNTAATIYTIPGIADSVQTFSYTVQGYRTGGSSGTAGDCASFKGVARIKNVGGTVTVEDPQDDYTSRDNTNVSRQFNVSGSDVQFQVIGDTDNNYRWTGRGQLNMEYLY